jgi:N-acetylglucosamine-6-phosphate deacetylase
MIVLSGATLVLPDRVLSPGTLVIEDGRIAEVRSDTPSGAHTSFAFHGHYIVPGFIDIHVHGVDGVDALDTLEDGGAVAAIAARLPRYGVTAFCPTTVACGPEALRGVLDQVRRAREAPAAGSARVLPAHLESNFINPEYSGAQPASCLRSPRAALGSSGSGRAGGAGALDRDERSAKASAVRSNFTAAEILAEIERATPDVGIVTMASELDGGLDLVRWLAARGNRVSLGHSGATYEEALAAIDAGARHATHLFNRMPPLHHRAPGLAGAVLQADEVAAEIICDGVHVHPAMMRVALAAKRPDGIMAITDGTAGSGLPRGSRATIGGRPISIRDAAYLDDGTLAGSTLTMDRAFAKLITEVGLSLSDAATACATTPARALGLQGFGVIAAGAIADVVVLNRDLQVVQTWVAGTLAWDARTRT